MFTGSARQNRIIERCRLFASRLIAAALAFAICIAAAHAQELAPYDPVPGNPCPVLGKTAMNVAYSGVPVGADILACLRLASNPMELRWYRAGTDTVPTCTSGYSLHFDGRIRCSRHSVAPHRSTWIISVPTVCCPFHSIS
jgi:hypothetical protein